MKYTPEMLACWLRESLVYVHIGTYYPELSGGIVFLEKGELPSDRNCLIIGECEYVAAALKNSGSNSPVVILCSGISDELRNMQLNDNTTLLASNERVISLYNRVQTYVHSFIAWDTGLRSIVYNNEGLEKLLDRVSEFLHADMAIINTGYRLICLRDNIGSSSRLLSELRDNGYLSFETVKKVQLMSQKKSKDSPYSEFVNPDCRVLVWPIWHDNTIVARFIMSIRDDKSIACCKDLGYVAAAYISKHMTSVHALDYNANSVFGSLVADLIENRISGKEELEERCKGINFAFKSYYYLLIVTFPNMEGSERKAPPWNYIISQLQQVFPFSNITTYHNDIIILARKTDYAQRFHFDAESVANVLSYYDAQMMVGNFSKFLTSLPAIYIQTRDCLRIALRLNIDTSKRVHYYEDYSMYSNIEWAANGMKELRGISNYVYLCHPAFISLLKHDRRQNTDYCNVLKVYLMSGRNAAEAARTLYLHRNTMLYKIGRIEDIIGQKLGDPILDFRLLYSCYVNEYVNNCLGEDILMLKKNSPAEKKEINNE